MLAVAFIGTPSVWLHASRQKSAESTINLTTDEGWMINIVPPAYQRTISV